MCVACPGSGFARQAPCQAIHGLRRCVAAALLAVGLSAGSAVSAADAVTAPAAAPASAAASAPLVAEPAPAATASKSPPKVPQPIDFPHARHAASVAEGGMDINCLYCHSAARRSAVAGIPTLAKCMGCHNHIATDKERIVALTEHWKQRKPVAWKKVHDLPDFVYFTHERHVQRFVFQQGQPVQQVCGYCHGDVKTMTVAEKRKKLTMGWCLGCHKQFQANPAEAPEPADEWLVRTTDRPIVSRQHKKAGAETLAKAPRDCMQCHK